MQDKRFCGRCGAQNGSEFEYCVFCGEPLSAPSPKPAEPCSAMAGTDISFVVAAPLCEEPSCDEDEEPSCDEKVSELPLEAVEAFAGINSKKVAENMKRIADGDGASFNFVAFLFGLGGFSFVYFFYRKMYKAGLILLGIYTALNAMIFLSSAKMMSLLPSFMILLNFEQPTMRNADELMPVVLEMIAWELLGIVAAAGIIVLAIIVGKKANKWYYNHMMNCFGGGLPPEEVIKKGGVNKGLAISSAIIYDLLAYTISFIICSPGFVSFFSVLIGGNL